MQRNQQYLPPELDSLWLHTAPELRLKPIWPIEAERSDVVIIGAGITGLRAALELASQGLEVLVLEAGDVGWGASGRSGGQVNPIMRLGSKALEQGLGKPAATRLIKATIQSANEVFSVIKQHDIDCDAVQKGWLQVAHCASAAKALTELAHDWQAYGASVRCLSAAETQHLSGSAYYHAALLHEEAGHIQPLSYARGLARAAMAHGARIYTHNAVTAVKKQGPQAWTVQLGDTRIQAKTVLLCTNGYTSGVSPKSDKSYLPFTPIQLATEPLSTELYHAILPQEHTIADSRRLIFYGRKTADKRLVFGGLGKNIRSDRDYERIKREAVHIFPLLKNVKWEYQWGGNIAMTEDSLPHIHELDRGFLAAVGCNGRGVAMGTVLGRVLAEKVLQGGDELDVPVTAVKTIKWHGFKKMMAPHVLPVLGCLDKMDK